MSGSSERFQEETCQNRISGKKRSWWHKSLRQQALQRPTLLGGRKARGRNTLPAVWLGLTGPLVS